MKKVTKEQIKKKFGEVEELIEMYNEQGQRDFATMSFWSDTETEEISASFMGDLESLCLLLVNAAKHDEDLYAVFSSADLLIKTCEDKFGINEDNVSQN